MEVVTVVLLAVIAPILVQAIKVASDKFGWKIGRPTVTIIVMVVSVLAAVVADLPNLPPFDDPMVFLGELLNIAGTVFASATILYNLLLKKVFELLGFVASSD